MNSSSRDHEQADSIALDQKTLRDEFAMISMPIVLRIAEADGHKFQDLSDYAGQCFVLADVMLKARALAPPSRATQVSGDSSRDEVKPYEAEVGEGRDHG